MAQNKFGDIRTEIKLAVIAEYAELYVKALSGKFNPKKHYIDCFSGTGEVEIDTGNSIDGSARIMLDKDFQCFHFVEKNSYYIKQLENQLRDNEKFNKCIFYNADVNVALPNIVDGIDRSHRALIFLDPFGLQVKWSTIEKLREFKFLDVFCLSPVQAIKRALPLTNNSEGLSLHSDMKKAVCDYFGLTEEEILDTFYEEIGQDLFGRYMVRRNASTESISNIFFENLKTFFPYVHRPIPLERTGKPTLFILFLFSTNNSERAHALIKKFANSASNLIDKFSQNRVG